MASETQPSIGCARGARVGIRSSRVHNEPEVVTLAVAADARLTRGADLPWPLPPMNVAQQQRQATLQSPGQAAVGRTTANGSIRGWRAQASDRSRG